jgi:hypothetical protein
MAWFGGIRAGIASRIEFRYGVAENGSASNQELFMGDDSPRRQRPRFWRLQFSLTSVFVLMTLSAIGVWYWYQRPFEVENKQFATADPFAVPGSSPPSLLERNVESVRRVWGGKIVRHGPRRVYDGADNLRATENYRNGVPDGEFTYYIWPAGTKTKIGLETFARGEKDGPSRRWNSKGDLIAEENYSRGLRHGKLDLRDRDGKQAIEGAYQHGRPVGKWLWFPRGGTIVGQWREGAPDGRWEFSDRDGQVYLSIDFDRGRITTSSGEEFGPQLSRLLARIASDEPLILMRYFEPVQFKFAGTPLKDVVDLLKDAANVPLVLDVHSLYEASISPDTPIDCQSQGKPLIIALSQLLKPHELACDFRYRTLCVTSAESASNWKDRTGVTQLVPPFGSRLAAEWIKTTDLDFVETPLKDVAEYLRQKHGGAILLDLSHLPPGPFDYRKGVITADVPVTIQLRSLDVKNSLGMILDRVGCKASLKGETLVVEGQ